GPERGDAFAHPLDDAAALVPQHRGQGDGGLALLEVQVAAAHAGGAHADQHLAALRRIELDRLDGVGLVDVVEDGGGDAHGGSFRAGDAPYTMEAMAERLADRAVELAEALLREARARQTAEERARAERLARMMADPHGKELTIALADQAFRSRRPERVAD